MSGYINKLRKLYPRADVGRGDGAGRKTDLPLDHRLTFCPSFDEKWTFDEERKICLNDIEAEDILKEGGGDIRVMCGLFQGISDYQNHVWTRGGKGSQKFNASVDSLKGTIQRKLGIIYDNLTGGVSFECSGEDFWINNVNVRSVLNLYRIKPTNKARTYLSGLRDKLGLILGARRSSSRHDGARTQAHDLFDEISSALEFIPPDAPYRLMDGSRGV